MTAKFSENRNGAFGGLLLIGIGVLALLAQFGNLDWLGLLILPALGAFFMVWGILTRQSGLMVPGGILLGIGAGTLLLAGPFEDVAENMQGGVFMLSFAGGWALITLASLLFGDRKQWWPLIPAGIMALIGGGLLFGGLFMNLLTLLGKIWPLFLILLGVWILVRHIVFDEKG